MLSAIAIIHIIYHPLISYYSKKLLLIQAVLMIALWMEDTELDSATIIQNYKVWKWIGL